VTGCVAPVKQAHKSGIQAGDVSVGETGDTTPDAHENLLNVLFWTVSPVGAGLGELPALKGSSQPILLKNSNTGIEVAAPQNSTS
jgi:hypothetical protein